MTYLTFCSNLNYNMMWNAWFTVSSKGKQNLRGTNCITEKYWGGKKKKQNPKPAQTNTVCWEQNYSLSDRNWITASNKLHFLVYCHILPKPLVKSCDMWSQSFHNLWYLIALYISGWCMLIFESCLLTSFTFDRGVCQAYFMSYLWVLPIFIWNGHRLSLWFSGHGFSSLTASQGDTVIYVGNPTLPSFSQ